MIESINIINIATCDSTGINIINLKRVNFIYGANASGKTIVSKFLYNPDDPEFESCSLAWKSGSTLETLVYNKDFRDRNFGKGTIDGVFTLGQATKEQAEEIEKKRTELMELKDKGLAKKTTLEKQIETKSELENEFKENVWISIYKKHENDFIEAFKGVIQKKESFKKRILDEFHNNNFDIKEINVLIEKAKTIFGNTPQTMPTIPDVDFTRLIEIENDEIWQKKIVGKSDVDIAKLIQRLNINDWVNEGRSYIQDNQTCPFCQQDTITDNFKNQLESYFDETFKKDTKLIMTNCKASYGLRQSG